MAAIQAKANYDKHDINKANRQVLVSSLVMTEDLKETRHNPQPDTVFMYWNSHKWIETDGNGLDWWDLEGSNEVNMLPFSCETCRILSKCSKV